jgi:hypothetical protein
MIAPVNLRWDKPKRSFSRGFVRKFSISFPVYHSISFKKMQHNDKEMKQMRIVFESKIRIMGDSNFGRKNQFERKRVLKYVENYFYGRRQYCVRKKRFR